MNDLVVNKYLFRKYFLYQLKHLILRKTGIMQTHLFCLLTYFVVVEKLYIYIYIYIYLFCLLTYFVVVEKFLSTTMSI